VRFRWIFLAVLGLTLFSAAAAIALQIMSAYLHLSDFESLATLFADTYKLGVGAILGMLGAYSAGK